MNVPSRTSLWPSPTSVHSWIFGSELQSLLRLPLIPLLRRSSIFFFRKVDTPRIKFSHGPSQSFLEVLRLRCCSEFFLEFSVSVLPANSHYHLWPRFIRDSLWRRKENPEPTTTYTHRTPGQRNGTRYFQGDGKVEPQSHGCIGSWYGSSLLFREYFAALAS